jgi:HEAT repeat protein
LLAIDKGQREGALSLGDSSTRAVLRDWLESAHPGEVHYALHLMDQEQTSVALPILRELLKHPGPQVRREALERMEQFRGASESALVRELLDSEEDPEVMGEALRTLAALGEPGSLERVLAHLDDPRTPVRRGALLGALRHGGLEGVLAAGEKLLQHLRSPDPRDRVLAADVLGAVGIHTFHRPLEELLQDPEEIVRRHALRAAARCQHPAVWPRVVANLQLPGLRSLAISVLASGGPAALGALQTALVAPGLPQLTRVLIVRAMGRMRGKEVQEALAAKLDVPDPLVRREALLALYRQGFVAGPAERERYVRQFQQEAGRATWLLAALVDLHSEDQDTLVSRALHIELKRSTDNVLLLVTFLHPAPGLREARACLTSRLPQKRTIALEVLDQQLAAPTRALFLPLLEDLSAAQRLERLRPFHPQEVLSRKERLRRIAEGTSWLTRWTHACALYQVGLYSENELARYVDSATSHEDPVIRETARWASRCV